MTTTDPKTGPTADTTEPRQYVARYYDDSLRILTATQLASDLAHAEYGDLDGGPVTVWTFIDGKPVNVGVRTQRGAFDDDDYADVRVELVNPADGTVLDVTSYRVDGRV